MQRVEYVHRQRTQSIHVRGDPIEVLAYALERGCLSVFVQAVEWFEKAAQAPAPTAQEGHDLLYDLADALEKEGEIARALAVALELQADAGDYRDVAARIDRLTKVQARG